MAARQQSRAGTLIATVIGITMVAMTAKFLGRFVTSHGVHYERARLEARTVAVAKLVPLDSLRQLTGQANDEQTTAFRAVVKQLAQVHRDNRDVRFVYLMGRRGGAIVFLADATDPASPDYSPPGEVYEEASPALRHSFTTGEPFVEGPTADRWGTWVSGLVPITDPATNRVIAILGLDVDATRWQVMLVVCRVVTYLILMVLIGLVVFVSRRCMSRPFA